ncbi:xanthine dehydrogenase family protein molybdopterin-binding subunit [Burkholderia pseudomallei]|nr:xanthine dehydrogenase family protein molybdopterin-binding subunit [Burkholderia pseudomallei]
MNQSSPSISRRRFVAGAGALTIGAFLPSAFATKNASEQTVGPVPPKTTVFEPNAFVRIDEDSVVTVISKHFEMGQGAYTGMATLVAEELDADWSRVRVESAPADWATYKHLIYGFQGTGGSSSIAEAFLQMRKMGAIARYLLVQAAAQRWRVRVEEITVENGVISHARSGRTGVFGDFAAQAARLPSPDPQRLKLKDSSRFKLIGTTARLRRVDSLGKVNGSAVFSQDIHEPDMLTVAILKPPRFGDRLVSCDMTGALKTSGVLDVRKTDTGIAVYARNTWAALQGRKQLRVTWDGAAAERRDTAAIFDEFRRVAQKHGQVAMAYGHPDDAFATADKVIEAEYTFPYVAHAPMEPLCGYLFWDGKRVAAKYACQIPSFDQKQLSALFGLPERQISIDTVYAGGSFGRRIDLGNGVLGPDLVADMAGAAKAIGPGRGVKVVWTREDDIRGGWYRPMILHRLKGAIKNNKIVAWSDTVAGHSFSVDSAFAGLVVNGVDQMMVEGAKEIPYSFEHFRCDTHIVKGRVPTTSLRSVASTHTGHAVESFIDQLLQETGQDPIAGRLALMGNAPREAGVLRAVAKAAGWNGPGPIDGRARGVGVAKAFNTYVAQIAEVSLREDGAPQVHKVWCAIDCGLAVNPDMIRAQLEGGIGYGLSIALYGQITLKQGYIDQSNFHDFRPLRMNEMPEIEVVIVQSAEPPTGVGELGVPVIGPAVGNALARLGRPRSTLSLPLHRFAAGA